MFTIVCMYYFYVLLFLYLKIHASPPLTEILKLLQRGVGLKTDGPSNNFSVLGLKTGGTR